MTSRWLTRLADLTAALFAPTTPTTGNPYEAAAATARAELERAREELARWDREQAELDNRQPDPEPVAWTPKPPRPDGLTDDQAAIAAIRRTGPCNVNRLAEAENISISLLAAARVVLRNSPDLVPLVDSGDLRLRHAEVITRARRSGYADLTRRADALIPALRGSVTDQNPYQRHRAAHRLDRISRQIGPRRRAHQQRANAPPAPRRGRTARSDKV